MCFTAPAHVTGRPWRLAYVSSKRCSMATGRGRSPRAVALLVRCLLVLLDAVIDQASHQASAGTRHRAKCRIATDGAKDRASASADRGPRQRTLLRIGHAG